MARRAILLLCFVFLMLWTGSLAQSTSDCLISASALQYPGKVWWARRLTSDVYTAGRLNERQVRYAIDAGFQSILMIWDFTQPGSTNGDVLPTTGRIRYLVQNISGLNFDVLFQLSERANYPSEALLTRFREQFEILPRPILVTCFTSGSASFFTLSNFLNQTLSTPGFQPAVTTDRMFYIASVHGLNFNSPTSRGFLSALTRSQLPIKPVTPEDIAANKLSYWAVQPIYRNWYISGQIPENHLQHIAASGVRTIVNIRLGVVTAGERTQEEVFLINIQDGNGTYTGTGRQSTAQLEQTRINPGVSNEYISATSMINYESSNAMEFGDAVGYNETLERQAVGSVTGLHYVHAPLDCASLSTGWFGQYKDALLDASRSGRVLIHDNSAFRAAYIAVFAAAYEHGLGISWAIQRLADLGYWMLPGSYVNLAHWLGSRQPSIGLQSTCSQWQIQTRPSQTSPSINYHRPPFYPARRSEPRPSGRVNK